MKRTVSCLLLVFVIAVCLAGCLPAPRPADGRVDLRVSWEAGRARGLDEIYGITAVLTRESLAIVAELVMDIAAGTATGTVEQLYSGEWNLQVDAKREDGSVIYTGQTIVAVKSGETTAVQLALHATPGSLDVTLEIGFLLDQGLTVTGGRLAIYREPESTYYGDLTRVDDCLKKVVPNLAPRSYDARVAVPGFTAPVFTSGYFQFDVEPGRTTVVRLTNDGLISIGITILPEPGRVEGLSAAKIEADRVGLSWSPVNGATGYRIYRTDGSGRFRILAEINGGSVASYTDMDFGDAEAFSGEVRYAVAALADGQEGLRSEPAAVDA